LTRFTPTALLFNGSLYLFGMPQEDKIKREIDRIGVLLAKLLGLLSDKNNPVAQVFDEVVQHTKSELGIDIILLLEMNNDRVLQYLLMEKQFSNDHLRSFANLLYEAAVKTDDPQQKGQLRSRALSMYEYLQTHSNGTLFLDDLYKIKELKITK
jgi:hypothetical protein